MKKHDLRKLNVDPRKGYNKNNDVKSVNFGNDFISRMNHLSRLRGFKSTSEFIRYACRKELDYQTDIVRLSIPAIRIEKDVG